jgi:hypothetical protein
VSHDQIQTCPQLGSLFGTLLCVWLYCFCLTSSHHHPNMNFYYISLLLLVVLSVYSESPRHPDLLDLTIVAVYPNSSSDSLGVLALSYLRMRCLALLCLRTGYNCLKIRCIEPLSCLRVRCLDLRP